MLLDVLDSWKFDKTIETTGKTQNMRKTEKPQVIKEHV